ncbi:aminotransferase class V-fold PLP-dependent enzyme [Clostridiaceae bacterium NSJ-31]|uniref:Aminotransferase class V-fold PLP-dependent enzyme n=1 Tax=Ligaoa zhengdingensis TaxID=2763658 RepID=A0A926DYG5_9FIRM|nr:aminotransferase class V-fold PLP-dependent enzyme [Ligaoa zhengdingensis]MBC8545902.1 aminotransferase class V-fold PLP-dependent enzyme [Ligaoa zhengdingensis]
MNDMIYLDNAATTFPKPECVYRAVDFAQRNLAVNVGRGSYAAAKSAAAVVDEARARTAKLAGAKSPDDVVFTPSATIALNEILFGLEWDEYKNVYVTPFEHNAAARPLEAIRRRCGAAVHLLPYDKTTYQLDAAEMERLFSIDPPDYVLVDHVSNVIGLISPLDEIVRAAKEYGAAVIVDASQSLGLLDIDLSVSGIDFLVFAGHKNLYAAFGVGGFVKNSGYPLHPFFAGGTGSDSLNLGMPPSTPAGYEFASPNVIAIASLNESLQWIESVGRGQIYRHKKDLMRRLIDGLSGLGGVKLYLPADLHRHTSVLSINLEGYEAGEVGAILDQDYGIAVRTGYHCAPYVHDFIGSTVYKGTVRLSLSYFNTMEEIDTVIKAVSEIEGA